MEEEEPQANPAMVLLIQSLCAAIRMMLPPDVGFALMIFHTDDEGFYYASNGNTQDINRALREVVKQTEVH